MITKFFMWLRGNSEKYLLQATQVGLARDYLQRRGPVNRKTFHVFFWRYIFSPLYRRLPWNVKHTIISSMPGSHRKEWSLPPR